MMRIFPRRGASAAALVFLALCGAAGATLPARRAAAQTPRTSPTGSSNSSGGESDIAAALSGSAFPLTLKLRDLNGDWRRLGVSASTSDAGGGGAMAVYAQMMASLMGGAGGGFSPGAVCYTRGQTVTVGAQRYLVVYRPRTRPLDFAALMRSEGKPPVPEKHTPDTVLSPSLLNLGAAASFDDIRPFNLDEEISASNALAEAMGEAGASSENDVSLGNLKQIGTALMMYAQDYDEVLPPMRDAATVKKMILPYVKNEAVFVHPQTKQPYLPNPVLSGRRLAQIAYPASFVAFYEAAPAPDNTRGVVFVDGHAKRISEGEWPRLAHASKIGAPPTPAPSP